MAVIPTVNTLRALLQKVIFVPIVYGFISLLPMFLTGWENSDRLADRLFSVFRSKENMFDFIVVGGGTAGALVANRLAEHYKVLLLEAGGTPSPFQTIPALALKFLNHPQTDWGIKTIPQRKACLNSINQQSSWSTGRGLGGTTNINFMTHTRGHPLDYESWAETTGDPSWGYMGVLPYFKRCETFSGTSNDPETRGHEGELRIRKPSYVGLSEDWIRAGQELGYPFVDLNGRHEEGFGILQYPIYKGIRQSTYAAFLMPMIKSPRLTVRRYALVRKILFRDMNNMAYGVEYFRHGKIETAIATKEVILSAGTLGSSKLLMLSGVGPRAHLEELGIPVRADLPVGRNLQDHLGVHLGPFFINEPKSFLFDRDVTPENIVRWLFLGTGPITTTGYQGAASISSSIAKSRGEGNWPDLHLILHGQAIHQGYMDAFSYAYGLQEDELMQYYNNAIGRDSFHIYVIGSRPTSTGRVLLSGASIQDPLVVNPKYLEDPGDNDFKVLLEGVKTALHIANSSIFQRLGTSFTKTKLPGCQDLDLHSDEYWECYIRRFTLTMHNPVGTAALNAVVDPTLKVIGTRGLRVVDASIQPTLVGTGTAAATFMIGEKGVDMILKDYGIPDRDQDLFDVIFGRNGFFKKNPILRILQREFDTINPLRALFKPFTARRNEIDGEYGEDAKERFTRNGGIDNPFLQVISTLFGNSNLFGRQEVQENYPKAKYLDTNSSVGVTSNVSEVELKAKNNNSPLTTSTFQKRSNEGEVNAQQVNVLSKNQWVLLQNPKPSNSGPSTVIPINTGLKITELAVGEKKVSPKKGKGGRRYALLQQILKMEAEKKLVPNLSAKIMLTIPTTTTTTPTTTPAISTTTPATTITTSTTTDTTTIPPPPVSSPTNYYKTSDIPTPPTTLTADLPFINQVNSKENEIFPSNASSVRSPVPKPISLNAPTPSPPLFNLFPTFAPPPRSSASFQTQQNNPLSELLKGLSSFEAFMNSLTQKNNNRPLFGPTSRSTFTPKPPSSSEKETLFSVAPSQNLFHGGGNNGNIFNFLTNFNNATKTGSGQTGNGNNPFNFLFGQSSTLTTPILSSVTKSPSTTTTPEDISSAVGIPGGDVISPPPPPPPPIKNPPTNSANQQNNLFSSWLKPFTSSPPKNQQQSSWFKPFDTKPIQFQQSSSSWLNPFLPNSKLTDTSSKSQTSSWFKPFNINDKSSSSSWFKPFTFNQQQQQPPQKNSIFGNPISSPTLQSNPTSSPPTDPFTNLFEIFFGGLKKHERREVFKTLNTMLEAGEAVADILGAPGGKGVGKGVSSVKNLSDSANFFQQISKGNKKRTSEDIHKINSDLKNSSNYNDLLKSLIAMNQVFNAHQNSVTKSKKSANSATMSDNSLEEFLSTFDYPPPPPPPPTHSKENSTTEDSKSNVVVTTETSLQPTTLLTITEDYTEDNTEAVTLEPDDMAPTSSVAAPQQKPT